MNSDPDVLLQHLDSLTSHGHEPGADLGAMLSVLIDDVTATEPSFLGLRLTMVVDEVTVTVNTIDPKALATARASLLIPLHADTPGTAGGTILFAADPGAFSTLAEHHHAMRLDGPAVLDQHLPAGGDPVIPRGVTGTAAASLVNIAVGILMDRGQLMQDARRAVLRDAHLDGCPLTTAAERVITSATRSGPSQRPDTSRW